MSYVRLVLLALAATALVLTSCGSSKQGTAASSSSTPVQSHAQTQSTAPAAPLSRSQIIAKTNAVCRSINARLNSVVISTRAQLTTVAPRVVSFERNAVSELNALTPPPALASDWKQVVTSIQTLATTMERIIEAVKTTSGGKLAKTVRALTSHNYTARRPMLAAAAHGGFSDCARLA